MLKALHLSWLLGLFGGRAAKEPSPPAEVSMPPARRSLSGLSDIYRFFRENTTPIYFVSPTPYNVLGIDDWVTAFRYVCYFDVFDGAHDHVFVPTHAGPREFETFE